MYGFSLQTRFFASIFFVYFVEFIFWIFYFLFWKLYISYYLSYINLKPNESLNFSEYSPFFSTNDLANIVKKRWNFKVLAIFQEKD